MGNQCRLPSFNLNSSAEQFADAADWAVYTRLPIDDLEPRCEVANSYRAAARCYLDLLFRLDDFMVSADDARLAWTVVGIAFQLNSVRHMSVPEIAAAIGVREKALKRAVESFKVNDDVLEFNQAIARAHH